MRASMEFTEEQLVNPGREEPLSPEQVALVRELLRGQFPGQETLSAHPCGRERERWKTGKDRF